MKEKLTLEDFKKAADALEKANIPNMGWIVIDGKIYDYKPE